MYYVCVNYNFSFVDRNKKALLWLNKVNIETSVISSILLFKSYIYYKYFIQFRNPTSILKNGKYFNKQPAAR